MHWFRVRHAVVKFGKTLRICGRALMARTFGEYVHSGWNGQCDYARYRWCEHDYFIQITPAKPREPEPLARPKPAHPFEGGGAVDPVDWRCRITSTGELRRIDGVVAGIAFFCPCGCGLEGWLPVNVDHGWAWDGNEERPTLNPSIKNPCGYHGYLKDGYFTPCVI